MSDTSYFIDKYIDIWWKKYDLPEEVEERNERIRKERILFDEKQKKKGTGDSLIGFQDSKFGRKKLKVREIDEKVHMFFHELLILGEDDPKQKNSVHL